MSIPEHLIKDLPDPEAVVQFVRRFEEMQPSSYRKLLKNEALLSDVLSISVGSPQRGDQSAERPLAGRLGAEGAAPRRP